MRLVRVYGRMGVGGAESHVLSLLEGMPGTEMVVYGEEGMSTPRAKAAAARYTAMRPPDFGGLVRSFVGADLVHFHTINNEPYTALAAQLAGVPRIVHTVHNNLEANACRAVDHTFLVGTETRSYIETTARSTFIPEGVPIGDPPGERAPGPIRLLEIRRPDKPMAFTLEDLLAAGAMDGVPYEAEIVGMEGESPVPGVRRLGPLLDPRPQLARADVLVHGSSTETFGRTAWEALAHGALPVVTPLPTFERLGEHGVRAQDLTLKAGISALRVAVRKPTTLKVRRARHAWALANASIAGMVNAQIAAYERVLAAPPIVRSFTPADVPDLPELARRIDALRDRRLDISGLSPGAEAVMLWFVADNLLVPDERRVPFLRRAIGLIGERPLLCLALGKAARHRGQMDLALAAWSRVNTLFPELATPFLERADHHLRAGQPDAARTILKALLAATPDHPVARKTLAAMQGSTPKAKAPRMFAYLRAYKRIIVTGPHRSGTTIAAEMIAADTGLEAVREEAFNFYREDMLQGLLAREGIVVQCPALFDRMPDFSDPDTAIVMMRRPLEELAESRERMFVPGSTERFSAEDQNRAQLARLGASDGDAAALKYAAWTTWVQSGRIHHPIEVDYAALKQHPMWVTPEQRRSLGPQWHNRRTHV